MHIGFQILQHCTYFLMFRGTPRTETGAPVCFEVFVVCRRRNGLDRPVSVEG